MTEGEQGDTSENLASVVPSGLDFKKTLENPNLLPEDRALFETTGDLLTRAFERDRGVVDQRARFFLGLEEVRDIVPMPDDLMSGSHISRTQGLLRKSQFFTSNRSTWVKAVDAPRITGEQDDEGIPQVRISSTSSAASSYDYEVLPGVRAVILTEGGSIIAPLPSGARELTREEKTKLTEILKDVGARLDDPYQINSTFPARKI